MLKKLNQKDKAGKELYQNVQTGTVSTLAQANFIPSMRKENRHMNDTPKFNNRLSHGEFFIQYGGKKRIVHLSPDTLKRKEAVLNLFKKIEEGAAKYNAELKKLKI